MLKTFTTILTSMVSVILLTPISAQATIFVPTDQPTIQAAIDAAPDFEDIFVEPGIYYENINLLNKHLFITSVSGPEVTIIDGGQHDSVVTYLSGRGGVIAGFTMRNGRSGPDTPGLGRGAGVRIGNASFPTIIQNVITGNRGCEGIGIASDNASPTISLNVITENSQFGCSGGLGGAAVSVVGDEGTFKFTQIVENIITNNSLNSANGGGISLFSAGDAEVRANLIKGNAAAGPMVCPQGGGIWIIDSAGAKILDNIIIGNTAGCGGGVYWSVPSGSSVGPRLVNNTIVDNNAAIGAGVFATGANSGASVFNNIIIQTDAQTALECDTATGSGPPNFTSNDILSTQGDSYAGNCTNQTGINGNISTDPLFVDGGAGDYRLQASSPLIDAGNNSAPMLPLTDFERTNRIKDGNRDGLLVVDIGAFESPFHFTTFLRGSGSNGNPSVLFLDGAPSNSTAKFKDSAGIGFSGGNAWQPVGSWSADSASVSGSLETLSDLHLWLGLKNNDDIGTRFDVAAEVWKNNEYIATGQVFCVTNVVRNQSLAKEVVISFSPFTSTNFDGGSDVLTLKVFTRIGTDGSGNLCAGHSNAQGLRVYFDSTDRNARFSGGLD